MRRLTILSLMWLTCAISCAVGSSVFGDDVLATFRMFHQQLNGEEVEEEDEDEDETSDEDDAYVEFIMPDPAFVKQKLIERGITMEDLVKSLLYLEHSNWGQTYNEFERRSNEIFGHFRAVIDGYIRHQRPQPNAPLLNEEIRISDAKPEQIDDYKYF